MKAGPTPVGSVDVSSFYGKLGFNMSEALSWWRVPLICYGVEKNCISVKVPMWDTKRYNNRIFLYYKKDMPPELWAVIKNGMKFHAEVPTTCNTQKEFQVRKVEIPNVKA